MNARTMTTRDILNLREESEIMGRRRLQQKGDLYQRGGMWKLRWRQDQLETDGTLGRGWSPSVDIGPAEGRGRLTEKEASRLAWENFLSKLDQNNRVPASVMTVGQFVEDRYIPGHVEALRDSTTLQGRLTNWVLPVLGGMRLRDVRKHHVQQAISRVLAHDKSIQLALHVRNAVSGLFTFAESEECFTGTNPAKFVTLPPMDRRERHALTFAQARALLQAIAECYRPIVRLALLTSLTIGEILGLKWRYVNLSDIWATVDGETLQPWCFNVRWMVRHGRMVKALKADARKRNIPLTRDVASDLLVIHTRGRYVGPDDPIFASRNGTPLDGHNILNRHLKPIGARLDMPWLCWHALRHTTATWADQVGMSAADRMALGGWSQAKTMMDYTHSDMERRRGFLETMSAKLTEPEGGVQ